MNERRLGFFARLGIAWRVLFDAVLAGKTERLATGEEPALPPPEPPPPPPKVEAPPPPAKPDFTSAVQVLAILQREGRFIDFLQEDVASYADADIGAAARLVHEGCRKALRDYFVLQPVRGESEGAPVTLESGFDPSRVRLTGNVVGSPPFRGRLAHHGWQAAEIKLPPLPDGHDPKVVAPAEVEL